MLVLSSCSLEETRLKMLNAVDDEAVANARLEEVIEALDNQDKDAMKALFSEQALNESSDFDVNMNQLFEFFQGKVDSWEKSSGPSVFTSIDNGHKTKRINSYYFVNTDKQKYFFLLTDHSVDTNNSDNVGLYLILVVKAEDEEKIWDENQKILFDGNKELSRVGIYLPLVISNSNSNIKTNSNEFKEDIKAITGRFPNLGNIEKCYWKADIIGENSRNSTPSPSSYWMKGFVVLDSNDSKTFKEMYEWNSLNDTWVPELKTKILNLKETSKWSYSEGFNSYIKSANYVGKFYMDFNNNLIYFDVER